MNKITYETSDISSQSAEITPYKQGVEWALFCCKKINEVKT